MSRTCLIALLLCMALPAGARPAPQDLAAAKRHYESGALFYDAGKYHAARQEFLEAYRLSQHPDLLYNLAQVSRHLGDDRGAIAYLETYLKEQPAAPDRDMIERELAQLRQKAALSPPPKRSHGRGWLPAVGLLGGGAACLIIGIGLGAGALATAREVEARSPVFDAVLDQKGRDLSAAAIAFDVIGAAALIAGTAWIGVWLNERPKRPRVVVVPAGAGVSVSGSY